MTRRLLPLAAVLTLMWTGCDGEPSGPGEDDGDPGLDAALATITAADVGRRAGALAHDSVKGRDTPSPGLESAAAWLAAELDGMGLEGAGEAGYLQRYDYVHTERVESSVSLAAESGEPSLVHGADYALLPSISGDTAGPVLWGGSAETTPDADGLDVWGRVVLYDLDATHLDIASNALTLDPRRTAIPGGAVALGFVVPPSFTEEAMAAVKAMSVRWRGTIPVFWVREPAAEALLAAAGEDLSALRAGGPQAADGVLRVRGRLEAVPSTPPNVVAVLPGSEPSLRDQYVVVSAHFDHVGTGLPDAAGDSIYNGADDNASGTVAVLEVAEALASLDTPPGRSVLFLLVSGEEKGLVGAARFAASPTVPWSGVVADVNLDMVGRNHPSEVIGVGAAFTTLGSRAQALAGAHEELGLAVVPEPDPSENLFFRSDQLVFACRDVPSIFFTTGLHPDYHRPSDEVGALDTDKIARVARLATLLVHDAASAGSTPAWTAAGRQALDANQWCP